MNLSNLIPQPFKEIATNYIQLKEQLQAKTTANSDVQITAAKVVLSSIHCFEAIVIFGLLIGMDIVGVPTLLTNAVILCIIFVKPEACVGVGCLLTGLTTIAILVSGVATHTFFVVLPLALIAGAMHYGFGRCYQTILHKKWDTIDKEDFSPDKIRWYTLKLETWSNVCQKYQGFIDFLVHP
jgi:hypothetical protein